MAGAKVITINRTPGDFVKKTRHLSVEDRGAYQEILDQIVLLGQDEDPPSLPDDDQSIGYMLGWTPARWRKTKRRLCLGPLAVLEAVNGRISQARIVEEIEAARDRIEKSSTAGVASGLARREKAALRERMLNASSTDVRSEFELGANSARTSHESRITKKQVLPSSAPAGGGVDEAKAAFLEIAGAYAPGLHVTPADFERCLSESGGRDPWWVVSAVAEECEDLANARSRGFLAGIIRRKVRDGWSLDDPKGYAEFRLAAARRKAASA